MLSGYALQYIRMTDAFPDCSDKKGGKIAILLNYILIQRHLQRAMLCIYLFDRCGDSISFK